MDTCLEMAKGGLDGKPTSVTDHVHVCSYAFAVQWRPLSQLGYGEAPSPPVGSGCAYAEHGAHESKPCT